MQNREYSVGVNSVRDFMYRVYGWMSVALAVTAGVAYWVASNPAVFKAIVNSPLVFLLIFAQLGVVWYLGSRIQSMEYSTAVTTFLLYSVLSGVTFSVYFYLYTMASIYLAFAVTAGTFFTMALYGYLTKSDLTSMGGFLVMGLFGLIIAMFANAFFQSPVADYYISLIAVGIFTLFTAYDVQRIKQAAQYGVFGSDGQNKLAIMGALTLYLDFINLFVHLLRILGKKKE